MKKQILTWFMTALLAAGIYTTKAQAETILGDMTENIVVGVSATLDVYDQYIWRGFKLDGDTVIQPGFVVTIAGFEAGFWGSWDVQNEDSLSGDEADGWIGYNFDLGFIEEDLAMIGISVGHTWYGFPETDTHTREFYATIALDTILAPYATWYHDYEDESQGGADGNYFAFGIGHSLTLSEDYGISLDLGYELGVNNEAFIVGDGGYNLVTAGFTIPLTENATLAPMLGYSMPFGDLEDSADGNQDDEFYFGASIEFVM